MIPTSEPAFDHVFWLWVGFSCLALYNIVAVHLVVKMFGAFINWAKAVTEYLQGRDPLKPPPPGSL
jgi:hypothetical protein